MRPIQDSALESPAPAEPRLTAAYLTLARDWSLWEQPFESAVRRIDEVASAALGVQCSGIWLLDPGSDRLEALDRFDAASGEHRRTGALRCSDHPAYFAALALQRVVDAADATADPRTRELAASYLVPNGIGALLDAALRKAGRVIGVLRHEHTGGARVWHEQEKRFAASVAELVCQLLIYEETRRNERRLLELSTLHQAMLDAADYGIFAAAVDGTILSVNAAGARMFGYAVAELVGLRNPEMLVWRDDLEAYAAALRQELGLNLAAGVESLVAKARLGLADERQWTLVRKDGAQFPGQASVTALRDAAGGITGYLAIVADVSERVQAQRALHAEAARYRTLFESAADSIFLMRRNVCVDCNPATLRMFACTREQMVGQPPYRFSPPRQPDGRDSVDKALEKINAAFAGQAQTFEWRHQRQDGTPFEAEVSLNAVAAVDEPAIIAIVRDVTARKRADDERRNQQALLQATIDVVPDLFLTYDGELRLRTWNRSAETLLGYSAAQLAKLSLPELLAAEDRAEVVDRVRALPPDGRLGQLELRALSSSGRVIPMLGSAAKIVIDGQTFLVTSGLDLSALKSAREELERSSEALRRQNDNLRFINRLSDRVNVGLDESSIVREALETVRGVGWAPAAAAFLLESAAEHLLCVASIGLDGTLILPGARVPVARSLGGRTLMQTKAVAVVRFQDDPMLSRTVKQSLSSRGFVNGAVIPLIYAGQPLGVIQVAFQEAHRFEPTDLETLEAVGKTVSLALANARHVADLAHQAHHDALTRLPNRSVLHEYFGKLLDRGNAAGKVAALMLLDLDRFKEVNDTLGHRTGDLLLGQIGPRLDQVLAGHSALVCRLGGDEFAIALHGLDSREQLLAAGRALGEALQQPFTVEGLELQIGGSIGIAVYPEHGSDSHELLRAADVAMYHAKQTAAGVAVYNRQFDPHTPERLALVAELAQGIRDGQLLVHYQPKLALASNSVVGYEALVRWQHPRRGLLPPGAFVPLAELSETIEALTQAVLDAALAQQRAWKAAGRRWPVAVNLSARSLIDDRIVEMVSRAMQRHGTAPGELELELTETALMHDPDTAAARLHRIAGLGVRLSIDDFGSGYSSLRHLRRFPIFALKIDSSFVRDMIEDEQDAIIVRSTIGLAHNLGLRVVAEGVENAATLELLRQMDCDEAQGFFLGAPAAPPSGT